MTKLSKKIIVLVLATTFIFSPILATKVEAQWVVWDPGNFVPNSISAANSIAQTTKDYGLDSVAWIIVNLIIERMAASTVNWINTGFKGSPAYVTDPQAYFQDIGDKVAGQFIFKNPNLNSLCRPINANIRLALNQNYIQDRIWQCTLTDSVGNMQDFLGDFNKGGWDKFFELSQRQQNNPIGAYLQAQNELDLQIATRQETKQKELNWGQGFMSYKKCEIYGPDIVTPGFPGDPARPEIRQPVCLKETTKTPGSVISNQLNKQLGAGQDKLVAADEINEIVSALLNQLITQVVGGVGRGLRGLSSPSQTNSSQTFTKQLSNTSAKSTVDYFGSTVDTSILDIPPPDLNANKPENFNSQPINLNNSNIDTVAITGAFKIGSTLATNISVPIGTNVTYQWQIADTENGVYKNISLATGTTYTPTATDVNKFIRIAIKDSGSLSGTITSKATIITPNVNAPTASDNNIGVYFWASPIINSGSDIIKTGVNLTKNLGVKKIRITLSSKTDLDYGISNNCISNFSLVNIAKRGDFTSIFSDPKFNTIMITAYDGVSFPDCITKNYLNPNFVTKNKQQIEQEYKDLANYLKSFPSKNFIISNWEGDNDIYCGQAYGTSATVCPNYLNAMDGFKKWVIAYSDGISSSGASNVYSAVEFNIARYLKNNDLPSVLYDVIPNVNTNYFSYSSYESINPIITLNDKGNQLKSDLTLIKNVISSASKNPNNLIIGEFGFSSSNRDLVKDSLKTAVDIFKNNNINNYFVWNLSDSGGSFGLYDANSQMTSAGKYVCSIAGGLNCI